MATQNAVDFPDLNADGELWVGSGTAVPVAATITAGAGVTITNGANSITPSHTATSGLIPLSTADASNDATVDFDNILSGSYAQYVVMFNAVTPATDGVEFQWHAGTGATPTYHSGASDYEWSGASNFDVSDVDTDPADTSVVLNYDNNSLTNLGSGAVEGGYSGWLILSGTQDTAVSSTVRIDAVYTDEEGVVSNCTGGGVYIATTAVTSLRFLMSSGNVESGTITVYGVRVS